MIALVLLAGIYFSGCFNGVTAAPANNYPSDVAVAWMNLTMKLTTVTPGFNSVVTLRVFGYGGLTLYESIVPDIKDYQSIAVQLGAPGFNSLPGVSATTCYWPASANAAMAVITKSMFGNASAASITTIDSLEDAFNTRFQTMAPPTAIRNAQLFGRQVASAIFEWSKTDGGHEAYVNFTAAGYTPRAGAGFWIPTPPAFGAPLFTHWGNNRSFVAGIAAATLPGAPVAYSEDINSPFYKMVNELYSISLSLTHEDSTVVKFWGDLPANYNVPAHATSILTQLIVLNHFTLDKAVIAYAKHGMAMNDAGIAVFKTKYTYSLVRPVSYIRGVMGHSDWNPVIPTPPHPEYSAAHAVVSASAAAVLENIFGAHYRFTDHTYDNLYGARTYNSFDDYAKEAGHARVLGGLHYSPSVAIGLLQGRKVGEAVNQLHFQKSSYGK